MNDLLADNMTTQLFYSSKSLFPRGNACDNEILATARRRNTDLGITGFLFRTNSFYMQILEGPEADLDLLMTDILLDTRHSEIDLWPKVEATQRMFPDWGMGYGGTLSDDNFAYVTRMKGKQASFHQIKSHLANLAAPYLLQS